MPGFPDMVTVKSTVSPAFTLPEETVTSAALAAKLPTASTPNNSTRAKHITIFLRIELLHFSQGKKCKPPPCDYLLSS